VTCVPLEPPVGCVLHVTTATSSKITHELNSLNCGGDARLTGGRWTLTTNKVDDFLCPDRSTAPTVDIYAFDDVTLTGTHTSLHNAVCGEPAGMTKTPWFHADVRFAAADPRRPIPVGLEPAGLRHCR
jgi:hypothetical protein